MPFDGDFNALDASTNPIVKSAKLKEGSRADVVTDGGSPYGETWGLGVAGAPFFSANASAADVAVTELPVTGKKLVITDLIFSVGSDMSVTFKEQDTGNVIFGPFYCAANSGPLQITTRAQRKLVTVDKKMMVRTSTSGNITVTAAYRSEA